MPAATTPHLRPTAPVLEIRRVTTPAARDGLCLLELTVIAQLVAQRLAVRLRLPMNNPLPRGDTTNKRNTRSTHDATRPFIAPRRQFHLPVELLEVEQTSVDPSAHESSSHPKGNTGTASGTAGSVRIARSASTHAICNCVMSTRSDCGQNARHSTMPSRIIRSRTRIDHSPLPPARGGLTVAPATTYVLSTRSTLMPAIIAHNRPAPAHFFKKTLTPAITYCTVRT